MSQVHAAKFKELIRVAERERDDLVHSGRTDDATRDRIRSLNANIETWKGSISDLGGEGS